MEKIIPIETEEIGSLNGRDCIYIDSVSQDDMYNLVFKGHLNGDLVGKKSDMEWIPYQLKFHRVIAYFTCELDTYENMDKSKHLNYSSFNIVQESKWLNKLPIRDDFDKSIYTHYQVFTYDFVYNIAAVSYDLDCQNYGSSIIDDNFHAENRSFLYFLHEEDSFNIAEFDKLCSYIDKITEKSDEIINKLIFIQSQTLRHIIYHFDFNDKSCINNLPYNYMEYIDKLDETINKYMNR